jgi:hypothetical protein|tara:strand:- start:5910 stop:6410 length:501 start_codon:yes stop_codon:yes gene_type:complete
MKKALVGVEGYIHEVVEPGQDYEIYNGPDATMQWVDAPDNCTDWWTLEYSPSQRQMIWVERDSAHQDPEIARKVAYGDVGEQLDMMYKDQLDGGTRWKDHVANVKATLPAPSATANDAPMNEAEMVDYRENQEPDASKAVGLSTMEVPCWKRYPGWHGYVPLEDNV